MAQLGLVWLIYFLRYPALEPVKPFRLPFNLSGVCSPSEANYCSNPFEVFESKFHFY